MKCRALVFLATMTMAAPAGAFELADLFSSESEEGRLFGVESVLIEVSPNPFGGDTIETRRELRFECDLTVTTECAPDPFKTHSTWSVKIQRDPNPGDDTETLYTIWHKTGLRFEKAGAWTWPELVAGIVSRTESAASEATVDMELQAIPAGE